MLTLGKCLNFRYTFPYYVSDEPNDDLTERASFVVDCITSSREVV